jgi:hypothetical protein
MTSSKRLIDSSMLQLMFFFEKDSDAAPKIATSLTPNSKALSKPVVITND